MAINVAETVENILNELKRLQGIEVQISEALRKHGLTLVKTAAGYDVLKLGEIAAQSQKKSPGQTDQTRRTGAAALAPPGYFKSEQPPTQPQQEPATLCDAVFTVLEGFTLSHDVRKILETAYYTSPPQRTWVGLTKEERDELWYRLGYMDLMIAIEDKLKEKNT